MNDGQVLSSLGARLRATREALGLSLHEVARLSGISAPALSLIETGKRDLRVSSLHRIAAALRVAPADLLSDRAAPVSPLSASEGQPYDLEDYA